MTKRAGFTTPLKVMPLPGGKLWELLEGFDYWTNEVPVEYLIAIPKGFITDFASVPRALWWLLPPWGNYGKAAVVHDYLYKTKQFSRRRSDQIFLEGMRVLGVSWKTRTSMYAAVRACGWIPWNKKDIVVQVVALPEPKERVRIDEG
jgi:hypothetical protein